MRHVLPRTLVALSMLAACGPWEEGMLEDEDDPMIIEAGLSEGAAMQVANVSCLQLKDSGTWPTWAANLTGVGTARSLAYVMTDLNRVGPTLTSTNHPPMTGYKDGFQWQSGDMSTVEWTPQSLAGGMVGEKAVMMVGWYHKPSGTAPNRGTRVAIADVTGLSGKSAINYRLALMVQPTTAGNFTTVVNHNGGLAWIGNYLYQADTNRGVRVFDLSRIREVSTSSVCSQAIGKVGSIYCAYGYKYVIPQLGAYTMPATRADGTAISAACKPKFSFLGKDTRGAVDVLLSGEYCKANDPSSPCDVSPSTGLGGRLYRWPLVSGGRLKTVNGYVTPEKGYYTNERNLQGVAPVMTSTSTNVYWLSSTAYGGALYRVSTASSAKRFLEDYGHCVDMPEGLHATASGTNLWIVTEGLAGVTNPKTGGRVVVYVDQAAVD